MNEVLGSKAILAPLIALASWSLFMMIWMYATRLPAMKRAGILRGRIGGTGGSLDSVLDERIQWKAHNYNHLMEQPTLFYAVAITLCLLGHGGGIGLILAWAYVALRICHSLVQATVNIVTARFFIFIAASLCLLGMTAEAAAVLIGA
jgi:hypothetical protein